MPESCYHPADRGRGGSGRSGFRKKKRDMAVAGAVSLDCLGGATACHRGTAPLSTAVDWGPGSGSWGHTHPASLSFLAHSAPATLASLFTIFLASTTINKIHCFAFFFFPLGCMAYRILVLQAGMEPRPPAVEAQSPSHWTTREVPDISIFFTGKNTTFLY